MSEKKDQGRVPFWPAIGRLIQTAVALCGGAFIVLAGVVTMTEMLNQEFGNKWWPFPFMVGVLAVGVLATRALLPAMWQPGNVHLGRLWNYLRGK